MKANVLTAKQRELVKRCVKFATEQQLDDAVYRAQALWIAAMLNAGYDSSDVERVLVELPTVTNKYGDCRCDGIGDYTLFREINAAGVPLNMPEVEL